METLKIGCKFSTVAEDIEKEQMTSPSPKLASQHRESLNIKLQQFQNLKTEEKDKSINFNDINESKCK